MSTLGTPAVTVEIGFGQSIGTDYDTITWTDVTDRVLASTGITCSRGLAQSAQSATAGQCSLTFDNDDGDFTPGRAGGSYGDITTKVPVRVTGWAVGSEGGPFSSEFDVDYFAGTGSTAYPVWTGFVTDWTWAVDAGLVIAQLEAADMVASAARATLKPWLVGKALGFDGCIHYWPMTDSVAPFLDAVERGVPLTPDNEDAGVSSVVDAGVESDLDPDGGTVAAFSNTGGAGGPWLESPIMDVTTGDAAISVWVRPTANTLGGGVVFLGSGDPVVTNEALAITFDTSGAVVIRENTISGTYGSGGNVPTGSWTHLYVERDASATGTFASRFRVWVNGSELSKVSGGASVSALSPIRWSVVAGYVYALPLTGQLAHLAMYDTLDTSRPAILADRGLSGPEAADRFLDLANLTATPIAATWMTADTTATTPITAQTTTGKSLLASCQEVADTCNGQLAVTRDGKLRLVSSAGMVTPADAALTLSAATDILTFDGAFGVDDADAISEVTYTLQPSGAPTVRRRTTPGLEAVSRDIWSDDPLQAEALADAVIAADPDALRAPTLSMSMEWLHLAGLSDALLTLDLGDRIQVSDLPAAAPASTVDLAVSSIEHSITASGWTVTLGTTAPVSGWILGDADLGLLGTTTILRA